MFSYNWLEKNFQPIINKTIIMYKINFKTHYKIFLVFIQFTIFIAKVKFSDIRK